MDELIARVREILATTPDRWRGLTATVPAGLLERRPAPGEWSALECLQHLLDTERSAFSVRLVAFREKRDFPASIPMHQAPGLSPDPPQQTWLRSSPQREWIPSKPSMRSPPQISS